MLRNAANILTLGRTFNATFQGALGQAEPQYPTVAMRVPSTTRETEYGWLGQIPNVREWLGDRVVHGLEAHEYTLKNRKFELTIGVKGDDIDDDNIGIYGPMFSEMGNAVGSHYDQLVWPMLNNGFANKCYDGQYMFDTDHPVLDENGVETTVANTDGGAGTPWFLIDTTRMIKPVILQVREPMDNLVRKDRPEDDNVFDRDEYLYGIKGRHQVGYGLWQFAWGSRQPLTKDSYKLARESMMGMKGDYGRPLGVRPTTLVFPPSLEGEALQLLNADRDAAGASNIYKGTATPANIPWLA